MQSSKEIVVGTGGVMVSGSAIASARDVKFPPSQRPSSFSIDHIVEKVQQSFQTVGSR